MTAECIARLWMTDPADTTAAPLAAWNLARYDASKCDFHRLNADAVDAAVLEALTSFYRTRHDHIADAIAHEQAQHRAAHADRHAELAAVDNELAKTGQAVDRYLTAFERGTMEGLRTWPGTVTEMVTQRTRGAGNNRADRLMRGAFPNLVF